MFQYSPLEDLDAIRIVVLTKGSRGDPVECQLIHADRNVIYEALSYEWGLPSEDDPKIFLSGSALRIRKNLWDALAHLRLEDTDRAFWIDAICIDQANIWERNLQVSLMRHTYLNAHRVVVWLGPAVDGSDLAMDVLADTTQLKRRIAELSDTEYAGLLALFDRSYWRRVWIQQELYLAREAIFHCGSKTISELALFDSFDAIVPYRDNLMRPDPVAFVMMRHRQRDPTKNTLRSWLYVCLEQKLQCTEPRDLIYGMLGLSNDCQKGEISPDYDRPLSDIFIDAITVCKHATYSNSYTFVDFAKDLANRLIVSIDPQLERRIHEIDRPSV